MPEKLDRCVSDVKAQGKSDDSAWGICVDSTGEKPHKEVKENNNHSVSSKLDIPFEHERYTEQKTKEESYPWGQCQGDQAKTGHDKDSANKIYGSIKAKSEIVEAMFKEHVGDNEFMIKAKSDNQRVNANRQVPVFNPPITKRKVEPQIDKTTKGIGGQVGKIDSKSHTNNMTTDLWKKILDSQLKRNVKEPRY